MKIVPRFKQPFSHCICNVPHPPTSASLPKLDNKTQNNSPEELLTDPLASGPQS